ncbi:uncharacterized protein LOC141898317 isoform X2 [Tubulanus polymorphus]|uniref:uncharacterized protein LOC141898317 isoform X2 n=1 Tax=Tubulanus polymorphus TaxID=672921 RepID=UPI003DA21391
MVDMRLSVLLAAFVAGTLAGPIHVNRYQEAKCARSCVAANKFRYETGSTYEYLHESDTVTRLHETSNKQSKIHIRAAVHIGVVVPCEMIMTLRDVHLTESDPNDPSRTITSPALREFKAALEARSLPFSFQDGHIEAICPSTEEKPWVLNVKRGILSTIQFSPTKFHDRISVKETDVTGKCDTKYSSLGTRGENLVIKKSKNLESCDERHDVSSPVKATPSSHEIKSRPIIEGKHNCVQEINRDGHIVKVQCEETHKFQPFSRGKNGATTHIKQSLKFLRKRQGTEIPSYEVSKRLPLTFDHSKEGNTVVSFYAHEARELIRSLGCGRTDIRPQDPEMFAKLTNLLKRCDYDELKLLHSQVDTGICYSHALHSKARKIFHDALPMVATPTSIKVMVESLISGHVRSGTQRGIWLTSLALIPKPTKQMVNLVAPLLSSPRTMKVAILPVTAMVYQMRKSQEDASTSSEVKAIVRQLRGNISPSCRASTEESEREKLILSVKGLGNIGDPESEQVLLACATSAEADAETKVAAIQATHRLPCKHRQVLINILRHQETDAEVRMNAYLALMNCPSDETLRVIKQVLETEQVNQVSSYIWSHLVNLMNEPYFPFRSQVRSIIRDKNLAKLADFDKRKFSRNYAASSYSKLLNMGAKLDSNLMWSPQSLLPRSASVNLTIDVFGKPVNLFELGGRIENLESFLDNYFGRGKEEPLTRENTRRTASRINKRKMDAIDAKMNARSPRNANAKASLYVKMFGNEMAYLDLMKKNDDGSMNINLFDLLTSLGQKQTKEFSQNAKIMEASLVVPTITGLPLRLNVDGTMSMRTKISGKVDVSHILSKSAELEAHVAPSGAVAIESTMSLDAFYTKSGLKMLTTLHSSTEVKAKFSLKDGQILDMSLDLPKESMEILDAKSKLFVIHREREIEDLSTPDTQQTTTMSKCTPNSLGSALGVRLCARAEIPSLTQPGQPGFPLSGPASFKITLEKTDSFDQYVLHAKVQSHKTRVAEQSYRDYVAMFKFDTPGSRVDRHMSGEFIFKPRDMKNTEMTLKLRSPWRQMRLEGKLGKLNAEKSEYGLSGSLTLDRQDYAIIASLAYQNSLPGVLSVQPTFLLKRPGRPPIQVSGALTRNDHKGHWGVQLQAENVYEKPIILAGELKTRGLPVSRTDIKLNIQSSILTFHWDGFQEWNNVGVTSRHEVVYKLKNYRKSERMVFNTKLRETTEANGIKRKYANVALETTNFPEYNFHGEFTTKKDDRINIPLPNTYDMKLRYGTDLTDPKKQFAFRVGVERPRMAWNSVDPAEKVIFKAALLNPKSRADVTLDIELEREGNSFSAFGQLKDNKKNMLRIAAKSIIQAVPEYRKSVKVDIDLFKWTHSFEAEMSEVSRGEMMHRLKIIAEGVKRLEFVTNIRDDPTSNLKHVVSNVYSFHNSKEHKASIEATIEPELRNTKIRGRAIIDDETHDFLIGSSINPYAGGWNTKIDFSWSYRENRRFKAEFQSMMRDHWSESRNELKFFDDVARYPEKSWGLGFYYKTDFSRPWNSDFSSTIWNTRRTEQFTAISRFQGGKVSGMVEGKRDGVKVYKIEASINHIREATGERLSGRMEYTARKISHYMEYNIATLKSVNNLGNSEMGLTATLKSSLPELESINVKLYRRKEGQIESSAGLEINNRKGALLNIAHDVEKRAGVREDKITLSSIGGLYYLIPLSTTVKLQTSKSEVELDSSIVVKAKTLDINAKVARNTPEGEAFALSGLVAGTLLPEPRYSLSAKIQSSHPNMYGIEGHVNYGESKTITVVGKFNNQINVAREASIEVTTPYEEYQIMGVRVKVDYQQQRISAVEIVGKWRRPENRVQIVANVNHLSWDNSVVDASIRTPIESFRYLQGSFISKNIEGDYKIDISINDVNKENIISSNLYVSPSRRIKVLLRTPLSYIKLVHFEIGSESKADQFDGDLTIQWLPIFDKIRIDMNQQVTPSASVSIKIVTPYHNAKMISAEMKFDDSQFHKLQASMEFRIIPILDKLSMSADIDLRENLRVAMVLETPFKNMRMTTFDATISQTNDKKVSIEANVAYGLSKRVSLVAHYKVVSLKDMSVLIKIQTPWKNYRGLVFNLQQKLSSAKPSSAINIDLIDRIAYEFTLEADKASGLNVALTTRRPNIVARRYQIRTTWNHDSGAVYEVSILTPLKGYENIQASARMTSISWTRFNAEMSVKLMPTWSAETKVNWEANWNERKYELLTEMTFNADKLLNIEGRCIHGEASVSIKNLLPWFKKFLTEAVVKYSKVGEEKRHIEATYNGEKIAEISTNIIPLMFRTPIAFDRGIFAEVKTTFTGLQNVRFEISRDTVESMAGYKVIMKYGASKTDTYRIAYKMSGTKFTDIDMKVGLIAISNCPLIGNLKFVGQHILHCNAGIFKNVMTVNHNRKNIWSSNIEIKKKIEKPSWNVKLDIETPVKVLALVTLDTVKPSNERMVTTLNTDVTIRNTKMSAATTLDIEATTSGWKQHLKVYGRFGSTMKPVTVEITSEKDANKVQRVIEITREKSDVNAKKDLAITYTRRSGEAVIKVNIAKRSFEMRLKKNSQWSSIIIDSVYMINEERVWKMMIERRVADKQVRRSMLDTEKEIVFQTEIGAPKNPSFTASVELKIIRIANDAQNYTISAVVKHPRSKLDLAISTHIVFSSIRPSAGFLSYYKMSNGQMQTNYVYGALDSNSRVVTLQYLSPLKCMRTDVKLAQPLSTTEISELTAVTVIGDKHFKSDIIINPKALNVDLKISTNIHDLEELVQVFVGYVNDKLVKIEVSHQDKVRRSSDALVSLELVTDHILKSRIHWKQHTINKIQMLLNEINQKRSKIYSISQTIGQELSDKVSQLKSDLPEYKELYGPEIEAIASSLKQHYLSNYGWIREKYLIARRSLGDRIEIVRLRAHLMAMEAMERIMIAMQPTYYQYLQLRWKISSKLESIFSRISNVNHWSMDTVSVAYQRIAWQISKMRRSSKMQAVKNMMTTLENTVSQKYNNLLGRNNAQSRWSTLTNYLHRPKPISHSYMATLVEVLRLQEEKYQVLATLKFGVTSSLKFLGLPDDPISLIKSTLAQSVKEALKLDKTKILSSNYESGELVMQIGLPIRVKSLKDLKAPLEELADYYYWTRGILDRIIETGNNLMNGLHRPTILLPAFTAQASLIGNQHFITFDKKYYELAGKCSYVLAKDFANGQFAVFVNYDNNSPSQRKVSLEIKIDQKDILIKPDYKVAVDGRVKDLPIYLGESVVERRGANVVVENKKRGLSVSCDTAHDSCTVSISALYHGRTAGLMGTFDNEQNNELMTPDGRVTKNLETLLSSWQVANRCENDGNVALQRSSLIKNREADQMCEHLFESKSSIFKPCFGVVKAEPYRQMCKKQSGSTLERYQLESKVCKSALIYVKDCAAQKVKLRSPPFCHKCLSKTGQLINEGQTVTMSDILVRSADVIFVVEEKPCNKEIASKLPVILQQIETALEHKGMTNNMYGLVGYGGVNLHDVAQFHTIDGRLLVPVNHFKTAVTGALKLEKAGKSTDLVSAVKKALELPLRGTSSKILVALTCSSTAGICRTSSANIPEVERMLKKRRIELHLVKEASLSAKLKALNAIGYERHGYYTANSADLSVAKISIDDKCEQIALDTHGSVFSSQRFVEGRLESQTRVAEVFGQYVAKINLPDQCQKCTCERYSGIMTTVCHPCSVKPQKWQMDVLDKRAHVVKRPISTPDRNSWADLFRFEAKN